MKSRSQRAAQIDTAQCIKPALGVIGDAVSEGKTHEWSLLFITLNQADKLEAPLPSALNAAPNESNACGHLVGNRAFQGRVSGGNPRTKGPFAFP